MELSLNCYQFKQQPSLPKSSEKKTRLPAEIEMKGRIYCRNCNEMITDSDQGIDKNGSHIHYCTNPAGHSYRFACYRQALGCQDLGKSSFEHSWFSTYSWKIAVCRACSEHLGWFFIGEGSFYGLIIDRLRVDDQ